MVVMVTTYIVATEAGSLGPLMHCFCGCIGLPAFPTAGSPMVGAASLQHDTCSLFQKVCMHKLFRISELESQLHTRTSAEGMLQQQRQVSTWKTRTGQCLDLASLLPLLGVSLQEHEAKIEELEESLAKVETALKQAHDMVEVSVGVAT